MNENEIERAERPQMLRICQINLNKCRVGQLEFINGLADKHDVVCIQEPYFDYKGKSRATNRWISVYPVHEGEEKIRSMILISTRLKTSSWKQIKIRSPDITAIEICTEEGKNLVIFNIYNDCTHSRSMETLERHLAQQEREISQEGVEREIAMIWLGDFNRHHAMWDEPRNRHLFTDKQEETEQMLKMLADFGMEMALETGINTRKDWKTGNETRPDNVFINGDAAPWILKCDTAPEETPPGVDHFPIHTWIEINREETLKDPEPNWRAVDWDEFEAEMEQALIKKKWKEKISTKAELEDYTAELTGMIQEVIEAKVPKKRPSPYAKRWWNKDLGKKRKEVRRIGRKAKKFARQPEHPIHAEWAKAKKEYGAKLMSEKGEHWEAWLENIDPSSLWDAYRCVTAPDSDGARIRIPPLWKTEEGRKTEIRNNEEKSRLLHSTFFIPENENARVEAHEQVYPEPKFTFKTVTERQIARAIAGLSPYKAPGLSGITNVVFKKTAPLLIPHLKKIFKATFETKHYPEAWRVFTTVVVRKPGKKDYTLPNAYRPIALLDTMAKILSVCIKETLEYWTEKRNMLPPHQYGGRPARTTTDAIHALTDFTKKAWRAKEDVAVAFMDVKAAFPSTCIPRLVHDMRTRGVPKTLTDWLERKMEGRRTRIKFDDFTSEEIEVTSGLDQGCNLSCILYNFYSAGQLEQHAGKKGELGVGYADDAMCAVTGKGLEEAARNLEVAFKREGGAKEWAEKHGSQYEYSKFGVMMLSRRRTETREGGRLRRKLVERPMVELGGREIKPEAAQKYLGVIIDQTLSFKDHADYATGKAARYTAQFKRLAKSMKGVRGDNIRKLYKAVSLAALLYAVDVWCPIARKEKERRGKMGIIKKMEGVQKMAALAITGGLRTTPTELLREHADILPMEMEIRKATHAAAVRIATLTDSHPLAKSFRGAANRQVKRHRSPLHTLAIALEKNPTEVEKIPSVRRSPHWKSSILTVIKGKEEAIRDEKEGEAEIRVYTDGSGIDGGIGAAVYWSRGMRKSGRARLFIGKSQAHEVYEGECYALEMGMNVIAKEQAAGTVTFAVDNQATIKALDDPKPGPGRHLSDRIHTAHKKLRERMPNAKIIVRWVPGHAGIPGNEKVDVEAKRAAKGAQENIGVSKRNVPPGWIGKHTCKRMFRERCEAETAIRRTDMKTRDRLYEITGTKSAKRHHKVMDQLPRQNRSILTQLRTEHVPLNAYLHRFKRSDSPLCDNCGRENETVAHYLLWCGAYDTQRRRMSKRIGWRCLTKTSILASEKGWMALFAYINETGRFADIPKLKLIKIGKKGEVEEA